MFSCTEGFFFPPRFGLHTLAIHTSWMSLSVCAQLAEGTVTFLSDPINYCSSAIQMADCKTHSALSQSLVPAAFQNYDRTLHGNYKH